MKDVARSISLFPVNQIKMGRKQSRRITLKRKHRIEKKVTDHHRKLRKLSKGMKKKARKDPGIPNTLPFKEEVLREVALKKQQLKEEEERKKEERKAARIKADQVGLKNLEELRTDAEERAKEHQEANENREPRENFVNAGATSRKYYFKEFKKVVLAADVIFEVLDARDPLSCRCPEVEQEVIKAGKKLVLLLNKIDLVPKQNVADWTKYLRREFPTLPVKASTQKQKSSLGAFKLKFNKSTPDNLCNSKSFGIDLIMKLLGNYSRNNDIKTAITIGIIGLPNVGKSSIINSLVRSKACTAGGLPGLTKSMQEVHLDSKIKLLDSPGIVMQKNVDQKSLVLRNCVPLQTVTDCVSVVDYMIKKMKGSELNLKYKVPPFSTTEEFLASVARKRGILRKGGVANFQKAARMVLHDWHNGRISYYTVPPKVAESVQAMETEVESSAEIISKFSQEIDIDALLEEATERIPDREQASILNGKVYVAVETEGKVKSVNDALLEQETVIEIKGPFAKKPATQNTQKRVRTIAAKPMEMDGAKQKTQDGKNSDEDDDYSDVDEDGEIQFKKLECSEEQMLTYNKQMKLHMKKMKRKKMRTARLDSDLAEKMKNTMDIDMSRVENQQPQKYDFREHFGIS